MPNTPIKTLPDKNGFCFTKQQRLLKPFEFKDVLSKPTFKIVTSQFVVYIQTQETLRLGLAIAKKHIKTAVKRNRVKRLLRENFRLCCATLPQVAIVVMSRSGLANVTHAQIELLWQQLQRKYQTYSAAS